MAKEIIHDENTVFESYAKRNPEKLAQRKAQYEEAIKKNTSHKLEFEKRIALINKALGIETSDITESESELETKVVEKRGRKPLLD